MIIVNNQISILFVLILAILLTGCALKLEPTKLSNQADMVDKLANNQAVINPDKNINNNQPDKKADG